MRAGAATAEALPPATRPGWLSAAASRRGTGHARRGEARQDAVRVRHVGPGGEVLLAVAADGAGSASRGGAGAALAVRALSAQASGALARRPVRAVGDADLVAWFAAARQALAAAAAAAGGIALRDLATTAVLAICDGETTIAGHVGDGAVVVRTPAGWCALSWPESGEHAGTTRFLTDEPRPALRIARAAAPVDAVAVLTDGIERLVLDLAARAPHPPFFDMIADPLARLAADPAIAAGRHPSLSRALGDYLDGEAVCARTDDDKTLAIAVRRPAGRAA